MHLPDSSILTNIHFPGTARAGNYLFEKKYITVRSIENRLYSDEEVEKLPLISKAHTHYEEWIMRDRSSKRLTRYLNAKRTRLSILEIGCGNGWLSHRLAGIPGAEVVGLDINFTELQQAARVFHDDTHLRFIYGDIASGVLQDMKFDVIVFSASIQYFKSIRRTMNICLQHLTNSGEIHVTDTHFYRPDEIQAARKRTQEYYNSLGYPEMNDYYFHHSKDELNAFRHAILHSPGFIFSRMLRKKDPFHWICIKNDHQL